MLPLGHIGITTAAVKAFDRISYNKNSFNYGFDIDYKVIVIGSMLPDIIDKSVDLIVFNNLGTHGHLIGHTVFFSLALMFIGYINLIKNKSNTILVLSLTCLFHQLLDLICAFHFNFLFPFLNPVFSIINKLVSNNMLYQKIEYNFPITGDILRYFLTPPVFIGETVGLIYLLSIFLKKSKNKAQFLKYLF